VIAGSQNVDSPIEKLVCDLWRHTEAVRRVLAIENGQVDGKVFLQMLQVLTDDCATGFSYTVADKQNFHDGAKASSIGRSQKWQAADDT
jgi:hypothetical protein